MGALTVSETDKDMTELASEIVALPFTEAILKLCEWQRSELIRYALWISPVWEAGNSDDEESAAAAVDAFLRGEERD